MWILNEYTVPTGFGSSNSPGFPATNDRGWGMDNLETEGMELSAASTALLHAAWLWGTFGSSGGSAHSKPRHPTPNAASAAAREPLGRVPAVLAGLRLPREALLGAFAGS